MALEVGNARQTRRTRKPGQGRQVGPAAGARDDAHPAQPMTHEEVLRERTRELREWLTHLDGWVDGRVVATQDLLELLDSGRVPPRLAGRAPARPRLAR